MAWWFWRWFARRPMPPTSYASTAAADQEHARAEAHARDLPDIRERLQRLSDELAVMTRDPR